MATTVVGRLLVLTISNPAKVYFPEAGITKLDVVRYYLAVALEARGARERSAAIFAKLAPEESTGYGPAHLAVAKHLLKARPVSPENDQAADQERAAAGVTDEQPEGQRDDQGDHDIAR